VGLLLVDQITVSTIRVTAGIVAANHALTSRQNHKLTNETHNIPQPQTQEMP